MLPNSDNRSCGKWALHERAQLRACASFTRQFFDVLARGVAYEIFAGM
jgi:hypothetical protein